MIIIYAPDGGESKRFPITPGKLRSLDAEAIEEVGGATWENFDQWDTKFRRGNKKAERAGLWICLRQENPALQFHDVDFATGDIAVVYDDDEKRAMRAQVRADKDIGEDDRVKLLDIIGEPAGGEDVTPLEPSASPSAETGTVSDGSNTGG
jgi:hypothetical protein